jgi:hypothetical protein
MAGNAGIYTAFSNIVLESDILAGKSRTEEKFPLPAGPFRKVC